MTRRSVLLLAALAVLVISAQSASAFSGRDVNLFRNSAQADVVCVGELEGRPLHGLADEKGEMDISQAFRVDRVLKGDLPPGSNIDIKYRGRLGTIGPTNICTGTCLAMLKKVGESYDYAFRSDSTIPVSDVARSAYTQVPDVRENLRWEIINSLTDESVLVVSTALRQAAYVLSADDIVRYVKPFAESDRAGIRAHAVKACLGIGDQSVVKPTLRFIEAVIEKEGDMRSYQNGINLLATSLREAKVTPDNLPMFARAMESENKYLRDEAARLIGQSKLEEAVPYLEAAMESEKRILRYRATSALNELRRRLRPALKDGAIESQTPVNGALWEMVR